MSVFKESLQSWQVFYATVAAAAATLTGLLFVSLSLNRERLRGEKAALTSAIARQTFGDFLYVLMIALVFIIPHQVPYSLAVALLALGLSRGAGLVREAVSMLKKKPSRRGSLVKEILLPLAASLGLLVVAVFVMLGLMNAVYGLVVVIAALLISACWNAWLLLMEE